MNRLVRAIAHALQRLAALLLGLAGNEGDASQPRPHRADGSPPPDWLRRIHRDPPRDWLERVRRGRPRWMKGSTPTPPRAAIFDPLPEEDSVETPAIFPPAAPERRVRAARRAGTTAAGSTTLTPTAHSPGVGRTVAQAAPTLPSPPGGADVAEALDRPEPPAAKKDIRRQRRFEGNLRARYGGPSAGAAPPAAALAGERPLGGAVEPRRPRIATSSERDAMPATGPGSPSAREGTIDTAIPLLPPSEGRVGALSVVYRIDELPLDADSVDPWPALPGDTTADGGDAIADWRGWERRQRLAREQRGD